MKIRVLVLSANKLFGLLYPVADCWHLSVTGSLCRTQPQTKMLKWYKSGVLRICQELMNAMDHKVFFFLESLTSLLQAINISKHCTVNVLFTLAIFISLNLAGSFMRLEITVISSIRLDAEVFSQRIFSIGKRICGFAWGKNGGRNKLLKLNLGPGMMASQLYTHAFNISPIENRRLCINGTPWIWHLLEECVENAWEYWSVVIGLISIVCFLFAALP